MSRGRLLGTIYQIKHNPIDLGITHARSLIEEAGRDMATNHNVPTLRAFFEDKFSIENVLVIFYWVELIIDLDKSRKQVKNKMRCTYYLQPPPLVSHLQMLPTPAYIRAPHLPIPHLI
jgi:hypothetical protein